jgi:small subunit ribosomal protein S16
LAATIRLMRMGKKKRPFYRLIVLDSRKRRDTDYLANLGYYNPFVDPPEIQLHEEEILHWLGKGAQVSETARALLRGRGILYHFSLLRQGLTADEVERLVGQWRQEEAARSARDSSRRGERERAARDERAQLERARAERAAAAAAGEQASAGDRGEEAAAAEEPSGGAGADASPPAGES